jgi:hypothetical protein
MEAPDIERLHFRASPFPGYVSGSRIGCRRRNVNLFVHAVQVALSAGDAVQ